MDQMPGRFPPPPGQGDRASAHYPLDMPRIFELTFSLFRFRWRTLLRATLVVMIPVSLLLVGANMLQSTSLTDWVAQLQQLASGESNVLPSLDWSALGFSLLISGIFAIGSYVAEAAVTRIAAATHEGRPMGAVEAVRAGLRRLITLTAVYLINLAVTLLIAILGALLVSLLLVATSGGGQITPGPGVFLGLIVVVAAFAALIFISVRWSLVIPVIVLENVGAIAALRRSWRLVAGASWRVLGYLIVFGLTVGIVGFVLTLFLSIIFNPGGLTAQSIVQIDPVRVAIVSFFSSLIAAALMPIPVIGTLLLYFDLRFRHGEPAPVPGQPSPAPSPPPTEESAG